MIEITTDLPHGNACATEVVDVHGRPPQILFAADPHGGPESLWFCFRIVARDEALPRQVQLRWRFFHTCLGAQTPVNVNPVLRLRGGPWRRLPAGRPEVGLDGQVCATWDISLTDRETDVALCYPYGPREQQRLVADGRGYWGVDPIGVTARGRPLLRLANDYASPGDTRPGLYFIARQHSGETPGSWVLDGLLRAFAEKRERRFVIWAVPLLNLDGVEQGDYGKDNFPYDLNRAWGTPPMRQEVLVAKRDFGRWQQRCRPAFALDSHAPGLNENEGVYGFVPPAFPLADEWAGVLAEALPGQDRAADFRRLATYRSRWETPNFTHFCQEHGVPAISLETPYSRIGDRVLDPAAYQRLGRRLARAITRHLEPRQAGDLADPRDTAGTKET